AFFPHLRNLASVRCNPPSRNYATRRSCHVWRNQKMQLINGLCTLCVTLTGIFVLLRTPRLAIKSAVGAVSLGVLGALAKWPSHLWAATVTAAGKPPLWEWILFGPFILLFL